MARTQHPEADFPVRDEGWWASVLAEDEGRPEAAVAKPQQVEAAGRASPDWERAAALYRQDEIVRLNVTGYNRGGLLVEADGLSGFVPCSHLLDLSIQSDEQQRDDCLSAYVGRSLHLKIIECVPDEGRMVFSERAARAEAGKRPVLFNTLEAGQRLEGEVTNVTEFGVFVDLGGVEGLIHISELSWGRVVHPNQICKVGQHVEVLVMEVVPERCRIALSLKRLKINPWETAEQRYPVGAVFPAVVTVLVAYGAFARLEEGLEGLIHATEIPLPPNGEIKDILTPGQDVQVRILQVEVSRQRLGLSMKIE
jgi:small subunit ribosomal protein S1